MSENIDSLRRDNVAGLFEPYFTLAAVDRGPLHAFGPPVAYERLDRGVDIEEEILLLQRIMPPAFRALICADLDRQSYAGIDPLSVPVLQRSLRWQSLCDRISAYVGLSAPERNGVSQLLLVLGYYEAVWGLNAEYLNREKFDVQIAGLAYLACAARYIINVDQPGYVPNDLLYVAQRAPKGCKAHFLATSRLLMFYGRFAKDAAATKYWREQNWLSLSAIVKNAGPFWAAILESRFWRSASFVPVLERNWSCAFTEMARAEECARAAIPSQLHEKVLFAANLYPVLQSTARLYTMTSAPKDALRVMRNLVEIDPLYCTAHVDLGQALLEVGDLQEAARHFGIASGLGPPVDMIGAFLAGYCHELLGNYLTAREFYEISLEINPQSYSPAEALKRLDASQTKREC